jgi:O-antigen/teichoic acid export membrane protein/SAM-dependent methyltransferase
VGSVLRLPERVALMRDGIVNNSSYFVSGLAGIFLIPIMLRGLGAEIYGIWIAALSLGGLVWGITPGFGAGVTREVAACRQSPHQTAPFVLSARSASVLLGLLGAAFICGIGWPSARALHLSAQALKITPWLFALVALTHLFNRLYAFEMDILHGLREFEKINLIQVIESLVQFAGVVGLIRAGKGLIFVASWYALVSAGMAIASGRVVARLEARFRPRLAGIAWNALREQIPFSLTSQFLTGASTAVWQAPPLLIGFVLGSVSIVPYQVGQKFPLVVTGISRRAADVLFPAASEEGKSRAGPRVYEIMELGVRWSVVMALPLCLVLWVVAPNLLHAWLKDVPAGSLAVFRVMVTVALAYAVGAGVWHVLWGRGAARTVLFIHTAIALTSVVLGLALLPRLGVVWGLLLPIALGSAVFLWVASRRYAFRIRQIASSVPSGLLLPVFLCLVLTVGVSYLAGRGWAGVILSSLAGGLGYLTGFLWGKARNEEVELVRNLLAAPGTLARGFGRRLRATLKQVGFLRSGWHLMLTIQEVLLDSPAHALADLQEQFHRRADPWDHEVNPLERNRHRLEIDMLDAVGGGKRFEKALEVGCAEGLFTEKLEERCESLLAVDISPVALGRARARRDWGEGVRFAEWDLRVDPMFEAYDLIVVIHTLEYLRSPLALRRARQKLVDGLRPGGYLLVGCVGEDNVVPVQAWWGRFFLRGGRRIVGYLACHPDLKTVNRQVCPLPLSQSYEVLFQKRVPTS